MTLTEEQLAALKRVVAYMDEMYSVASPYHGCTEDANLLRAMIDSSDHIVEPDELIGFDLERARGLRDFLQDDCAEVGDVWGEMIAEIERLRADLEQSEEIKRLKDELENYGDHYACLLISKDAQIKELEGMLSIRTEELDIAHSVARSEKEMHEKELAAFARRIKELEDALVEERARVITSHPLTHVIDEDRTEASMQLQAEGKIGPDAKPRVWQITDERKAALAAMSNLSETISCPDCGVWIGFADIGPHMAVLRAMLREAE